MAPARHKYRTLFFVLIVLIVLFPVLRATPATRVLLDVLLALVFVVSIVSVFTPPRLRVAAVLLGVPTLAGVLTGYFVSGVPSAALAVGVHTLSAVFFALTIAVILQSLHSEAAVTVDSVYGAFCGYMLTGLAFGHLYSVVELAYPGSYHGGGFAPSHHDSNHYLLTYFSFLTLTTVGYGDIVPGTDTARGLAIVEAIVGQFYLAVLVAELIGKRVSQSYTPPPTAGDTVARE